MSEKTITATLRWVRNGAGPELDCPHSLFEIRVDDGNSPTVDLDQCRRLLKVAQLPADESERQILAAADVFQAFAIFALLLQRRAGYTVARHAIIRQDSSSALVAVEHIWAPAAEWAAQLAAEFAAVACNRLVTTGSRIVNAIMGYEKACKDGPCIEHRYLYLEARRRGMPSELRPPFDLVLGQGVNQRRLHWMTTERTSHLAVRLARSKTRTLRVLREAGLPVPMHIPVSSLEAAQKAAQRIGFPVVVKPANTDRGVSVTLFL